MANPPFNVDEIDAAKMKDDPRLTFGLPGVNKGGKVSNGNYVWMSFFHSYLSERGRAGIVMSSQASSAGGQEAKVHEALVKSGDMDIMCAIRGNCRAVFRKYKACLTFARVEIYKPEYQAINYIYSSLQDDKAAADTAAIIQRLDAIVAEAIEIEADADADADAVEDRIFDISKVNFDLLRKRTQSQRCSRPTIGIAKTPRQNAGGQSHAGRFSGTFR